MSSTSTADSIEALGVSLDIFHKRIEVAVCEKPKCDKCVKNNLEIENLKRLLASISQRLDALKTI
jgi:hypothetical protein